MEAFKALSFSDKWHVSRCVYRGEAPRDPRLAPAAIELAESYQRQRSGEWLRWFAIVVGVVVACVAVLGAIAGDVLTVVVFGLAALVNIGQVALNPRFRPKNVARSLEASRQLTAQDG